MVSSGVANLTIAEVVCTCTTLPPQLPESILRRSLTLNRDMWGGRFFTTTSVGKWDAYRSVQMHGLLNRHVLYVLYGVLYVRMY